MCGLEAMALIKPNKGSILFAIAVCTIMLYMLISVIFSRAETIRISVNDIPHDSDEAVVTKVVNTSQNLYPNGIHRKHQTLSGLVFSDRSEMGSTAGEFSFNVTLSVIKSLSQSVLKHVKEIFNDDHEENVYHATIPAMIKHGNKVEIVQRIWLGQYEKMKQKYRNQGLSLSDMFNEWQNSWQENYFYHMVLDENYNLMAPGGIMGIPTTTNVKFTYKSDGTMDPRLVRVKEDIYLVFHTWLVDKNSNNDVGGRVHIWDMLRHIKKRLWPHIPLQRTEINWIAFDKKGELHLTYSLDPLRVMKCNPHDGDCQFVFEQEGSKQAKFEYTNDHLRGGTPWLEYQYPYYISLTHGVATTYKPYQDFAIYSVHLVVLDVESWRIVYVSRNIQANKVWLTSDPLIRNHTIIGEFWYPTGLILQTDDIVDISCHLNDASGHVLRMSGIKQIVSEAIKRDKLNTRLKGPSLRVVQQYVLETTKAAHPEWTFLGDIINHTVEGVDIIL